MTRVSFAVQAHPARADLAEALALEIRGQVVYDPEPESPIPSPWRTYRHLLETTPGWATHRFQIQDDCTPCPHLHEAVQNAVRAQPHSLLVFFVGGNPHHYALAVQEACGRDETWVTLPYGHWCPAVSTCWPVEMIDPFLTWVDEQRYPEGFTADDEIIGRWLHDARLFPLAAVPSLVQHHDVGASLNGRRAWAGEDPGRVAACWVGDCDECMDARAIMWTS